jgi:hypothetical protein
MTMMLTATCHVEGCGNADHAIELDFLDPTEPPPSVVICGACGNAIDDVKETP